MFHGKSITSWLIKILVLAGLLPGGNSKSLDWFRFTFWLLLETCLISLWIYVLKDSSIIQTYSFDLPSIMIIVATIVTLPAQSAGISLTLSYPRTALVSITQNKRLKPPQALPVLLMIIILSGLGLLLIDDIADFGLIFKITQYTFTIQPLIGIFFVDVCVTNMFKADFHQEVHCIESALKIAESEILHFKSMKDILSPLLLFVIVPQGFIITANSWMIFSHLYDGWTLLVVVVVSLITMTYICYIVNDCYTKFKDHIPLLR